MWNFRSGYRGIGLGCGGGHRDYRSREPIAREESALEILQKRYASGEIGKGEYERIKADLTGRSILPERQR